jgi:outer membrane receptor for ferrienterochelin and colicins
MTKGACFCLMLLGLPAMNWAAEIQSAADKAADPTEISFEELIKMEVWAASRFWQKTAEAPSSVTIITSDEVKKYGHRTLAEILETVPGLYISYDRNYSFLGMRGFSLGDNNNRVLLLVNGHRMNNSLSDSAFIGSEFILDVDLIDRVEIIRGPGSSLYGNNAFFGVINVITRDWRSFPGHGFEVSGEAGSFDSYKGRVTFGKLFKNEMEVLLSGSIYDSQGQGPLFYEEFNTPAQNNGIAQDADTDHFKSVFGSVRFKDFTLEGGFITREKRNPTAQFLTDFNDRRLRTTDDRSYVALNYVYTNDNLIDVTAKLYYDRHEFDTDEPYAGVLYHDSQKADWWGAELQLTKRIRQHTFTFGGEFRDDFRQEEKFYNVTNGVVSRDLQRSRQNHGIYFQGDVAILTNLHLNAGARYDHYGDFDPTFNPRVALIYNPIDQTTFKAIYGRAFRAPNFFELSDQRNQDIMPETISTYALVYEQGIGDELRSSVAGFYNQIDDLIAFNSAPGHQRFENLSGAEAKGIETALEGFWRNTGIRGRISYTFQRTEDSETGRVLTDSPAHLGKLNVSVPVWTDKIFAGLEFQYVSSRKTTRLTPLGTAEPGEDASGFGLINFTLFSQNLVKNLDLSVSIYNLLDKRYGDPSTPFHQQDIIQQDGRSFRVKLTYRF